MSFPFIEGLTGAAMNQSVLRFTSLPPRTQVAIAATCGLVLIGLVYPIVWATESLTLRHGTTLVGQDMKFLSMVPKSEGDSKSKDIIFAWGIRRTGPVLVTWEEGTGEAERLLPEKFRRWVDCSTCDLSITDDGDSLLGSNGSGFAIASDKEVLFESKQITTGERRLLLAGGFLSRGEKVLSSIGNKLSLSETIDGTQTTEEIASSIEAGFQLTDWSPTGYVVFHGNKRVRRIWVKGDQFYREDYSFPDSRIIEVRVDRQGDVAVATDSGVRMRSWKGAQTSQPVVDAILSAAKQNSRLHFLGNGRILLEDLLLSDGREPEAISELKLKKVLGTTRSHIAIQSPDGKIEVLPYTIQPTVSKTGFQVIIGCGVGLLLTWISWVVARTSERRTIPQINADEAAAALPEGLVAALRNGSCVLFAGPGLSRLAGWPDEEKFLRTLVTEREAVDSGATTVLITGIPDVELRTQILKAASGTKGMRIHRALAAMPFRAVVTAGHDLALEGVFSGIKITTPEDSSLREKLGKGDRFLLKIHGDPHLSKKKLTMTPRQFETTLEDSQFEEFWKTLFAGQTVLFVGFEPQEIEEYARRQLRLSANRSANHYAVVPERATFDRAKNYWKDEYNTVLIPVESSTEEIATTQTLETIGRAANSAGKSSTEQGVVRLESVKLKEIGPFRDLEVAFDKEWTILLGDNGVGKSTILRAVATALAGKESAAYADRLIRAGEPTGSIALKMSDGTEYITNLRRSENGATVETPNDRPLTGGFFSIAFPASRTLSWNRVEAAPIEMRGYARANDVAPLLSGDTDPRLDKLKQWVISLEFEIAKGKREYAGILADFLLVARVLTKSQTLDFKGVTEDNRVKVKTVDGELPLEALSQGTGSLLSWVGLLVQRLHQIYPAATDGGKHPRHQPALVIVDELDAHMHPAWQWGLTERLREVFPGAQFLASTHSPLIVAGMTANQVKRFVRNDEGRVVESTLEDYMLRGRADQVLTSSLFGLDSTLDPVTAKRMDRYRELKGRDPEKLTKAEKTELGELDELIEYDVPAAGETPIQYASALVQTVLETLIPGKESEKANARAQEAADRLLRMASERMARGEKR